MGVQFRYTPPQVDARILLAAAAPLAVQTAAQMILDVSNSNAPRDTGQMVDTSEVTVAGHKATISYPATSPEGYPYPVKVHEDLTANHPNGGSAKFLESAFGSEAEAAAAAEAGIIRKALT